MVRLKALWNRLVPTLTAILLFGMVVTTSYNFWKVPEPDPYTQLRVEVLTRKVSVGGVLRVEGSGVRNRICKAEAHRFFIEAKSGVTRFQEIAPSGASKLGPFTRAVDIQLPDYLGPGTYLFRSILVSDCGLEVFSAPFGDAAFEIVINQD